MEKKLLITIVAVIAVVMAGAAAAVMMTGDSSDEKGQVTVTDYLGREVTIGSVDRIVSQSATPTAILCGLGMSSNLMGVSTDPNVYDEDPYVIGQTQDDFPNAVTGGLDSGKIKGLGPMSGMSAETIIEVTSDLVVLDVYGSKQEMMDALDTLGITYVVVAVGTLDEVYDAIGTLGKAVGKESEADRMISEMRSAIAKISDWCKSVVEEKRNGEKFDVALMMTAKYAIGPDYIGGQIIESLYVNNVFEGVGRYAPVTTEAILDADPEVIIYQSLGMGDDITDPAAYVLSLQNDPVLGKVRAAESGLVFTTIGEAKNAASHANQGIVRAYAMYAMFIYQDYLTFDISKVFNGDNYIDYLSEFWEMIDS